MLGVSVGGCQNNAIRMQSSFIHSLVITVHRCGFVALVIVIVIIAINSSVVIDSSVGFHASKMRIQWSLNRGSALPLAYRALSYVFL